MSNPGTLKNFEIAKLRNNFATAADRYLLGEEVYLVSTVPPFVICPPCCYFGRRGDLLIDYRQTITNAIQTRERARRNGHNSIQSQ